MAAPEKLSGTDMTDTRGIERSVQIARARQQAPRATAPLDLLWREFLLVEQAIARQRRHATLLAALVISLALIACLMGTAAVVDAFSHPGTWVRGR